MPAYFQPEDSADVFDPATDWEELCEGLTQTGGGASFARDAGEAALVGSIPANKKRSAIQVLLGTAWAGDGTGGDYALHRTLPVRHPDFPFMRADSVAFVDYNPIGNPDQASNKAKIAAAVPGDNLAWRFKYSRSITTLRFKPHNFPFVTDAAMVSGGLQEYYRNCVIFDSMDPSLELLLADTMPFLQFIEGTDSTGASLVGRSFPSPVAERIQKTDMVLGWFSVPVEFVANPYLPSKIVANIGKCNQEDNWLTAFPKGTLLLDGVRVKRSQQQIWTVNDRIPFLLDIFFMFKLADPTAAVTKTDPPGTPIFKGWNLFPLSRTGGWFSAARGGNTSDPFVPFGAFDGMFTHVLAP
jgi:hypothetical protein